MSKNLEKITISMGEERFENLKDVFERNAYVSSILDTFHSMACDLSTKKGNGLNYYQPEKKYRDEQKNFENAAKFLGFDVHVAEEQNYLPDVVTLFLAPKPITEKDQRSIAHILFDGLKKGEV